MAINGNIFNSGEFGVESKEKFAQIHVINKLIHH